MNITSSNLKAAIRNGGVTRTDRGSFRVAWTGSYGDDREVVLTAPELRPLLPDAAHFLGRSVDDLTAELNALPSPVDPGVHPTFGTVFDRKTRSVDGAGFLGTGAGRVLTQLVLVELAEDFIGYHPDDTEVVTGTGYKAGDRLWVRDHAPVLEML